MKWQFVDRAEERRLILIFAGWAMDARPFAHLRCGGYDIAVVWDYRSLDADWAFTEPYDEICILAWSLGVAASTRAQIPQPQCITRRIAVNGTLNPVDDTLGIPSAVFAATADGLCDASLRKFYRRVCGSGRAFNEFCEHLPERDIDELTDELRVFLNGNIALNARFDLAIVSDGDAIFPPANLRRAWADTPTVDLPGAHLPDFQHILDRFIIDKQRMTQRFERGFDSYDAEATPQKDAAMRLLAHAQHFAPDIFSNPASKTIEIGSGTGLLSRQLDKELAGQLEMWDIAGEAPLAAEQRTFRQVDAELAIAKQPDESVDMIISSSTVQWFNSPARFIDECRRVLRTHGLLAFSTFAPGNLAELQQACKTGLHLLSADEWQTLAHGAFEVLAIDSYDHTLHFKSATELLRHIKHTGVNSLKSPDDIRTIMGRFQPDDNSEYPLTYRPLIIILRKQ